ncbi:MAG: hypothetical protein IH591_14340 [Bacteroidales bacterium]|nr:hypothetical protein [Bacteroidales bacterium]
MKNLLKTVLVIISVLMISAPAMSQDYKMTIKTNPLSALGGPFWLIVVPVTGEYKVFFETKTTEKQSLQIGVSYIGPSLLLNLDDLTNEGEEISGVSTSGVRGQLMYKFFISRDLSAPEGFYLAPHFSYATAKIANKDDANEYVKGTKINVNGLIGYQMITSGGFTLDLFTGMGFVSREWQASGEGNPFDLGANKSSVNVAFGFSFGFAF